MDKLVITVSGNIGVGKTTLGEYIAKHFDAVWLPESQFSMHFQHLIAHDNESSRAIAQSSFACMRVATLLSAVLDNDSRIIVVERNLRDSIIFHEVWEKLYGLEQYKDMFNQLYCMLGDNKVNNYTELIIWLKCPIDTILHRLQIRELVSETAHTKEVLILLENKYNQMYNKKDYRSGLFEVDTDKIKLEKQSIDEFLYSIERFVKNEVGEIRNVKKPF